MKKRITAFIAALALILAGAATAYASSSSAVYLLAANDKFCDLPGGTLPISVHGTIYVPYTLFDKDATGVDLGVYYGLKQEQGTVLSLYSMGGHLTFRVTNGTCEDEQGNSMGFRALIRYNIPYVPAAAVCKFFALQYSFLPTTDRGTLIRITNASASLSDSLFLSSARSSMLDRYNSVLQSREPQTPLPVVTPVPGTGPSGPSDRPDKSGVRVYLAVDASDSEEDLTGYFPAAVKALFLFTPDCLIDRADQVRAAVAAGHSIGLIVEGDGDAARAELRRGNELLGHIARVNTHIVSAPEVLAEGLEREGWRCWRGYSPGATSNAVLSWLDNRRGTVRLDLPAGANVSRILTALRQDKYSLRQPVETDY